MAGNNEMAQVMKMTERMQARVDESEKKMELTSNALQSIIKDSPKKYDE